MPIHYPVRRPRSPQDSLPHPVLRWTAAFCAVLVWLLGVLEASPDLHELIHPDAGHPDHVCAVTLFSQGLENPAVGVVLALAPVLVLLAEFAPTEPRRVESVRDWLLPGRGPPVC